jgi:ubiquinone/menaquinone biosynthesis C-methylase UbiE
VSKQRVPETDQGITGEFTTHSYDKMMRRLRDRGWMETGLIIKGGITYGLALEVGPGPGYLGLEWLKKTTGTRLQGLDISEDMLVIAGKNAAEYGLSDRVEYIAGDARKMPFEDGHFDVVFTNGSMHEWAYPEEIINEIDRVLKPGGKYFISDLRRDAIAPVKWFLWLVTGPKEMRQGLITSLNAAYIMSEVEEMFSTTKLQGWQVNKNLLGIVISGQKT